MAANPMPEILLRNLLNIAKLPRIRGLYRPVTDKLSKGSNRVVNLPAFDVPDFP